MQSSKRILIILSVAAVPLLFVDSPRADEKPMMKAAVAHEYGAPEVLKIEEVPRPEPNEDEALVRVIASGVNPAASNLFKPELLCLDLRHRVLASQRCQLLHLLPHIR